MKTYRIKIICSARSTFRRYKIVTVSNADELRGEIENFCVELEDKYSCSVRCDEVELLEDKRK